MRSIVAKVVTIGSLCAAFTVPVQVGQAAAPATPQGAITAREFWIGAGVALPALTNNANFPNSPDITAYPTYFEWPQSSPPDINTAPPGNVRQNYGVQVVGYYYPTVSGNHVFMIATDDGGELRLGTSDDPATSRMIAQEPVWNPVRSFTATARRTTRDVGGVTYLVNWSNPINLNAGTPYFIEGLMKEEGGGDNIAVTVLGPGDVLPAPGDAQSYLPIPGTQLSTIDRTTLLSTYVSGFTGKDRKSVV